MPGLVRNRFPQYVHVQGMWRRFVRRWKWLWPRPLALYLLYIIGCSPFETHRAFPSCSDLRASALGSAEAQAKLLACTWGVNGAIDSACMACVLIAMFYIHWRAFQQEHLRALEKALNKKKKEQETAAWANWVFFTGDWMSMNLIDTKFCGLSHKAICVWAPVHRCGTCWNMWCTDGWVT